jgi:hypothetical protein
MDRTIQNILAISTAAKLKGYPAWVHIPRLKLYPPHSYHSTLIGPTSLKISWLQSILDKKPLTNVLYFPLSTIPTDLSIDLQNLYSPSLNLSIYLTDPRCA